MVPFPMGNQTRIKENKMKKLLGIVMGLGLACAANATIIANYEFTNDTTANVILPTSGDATTSDADVTAGSWTSGAGFTGAVTAAGSMFTSIGNGVTANNTLLSTAITNNDYFEVTIGATEGNEISYSELTFDALVANVARSATEYAIVSSINGYTEANVISSGSLTTTSAGYTVDLSGTEYQNVDTDTTFRIYVWGAGSTASSSLTSFDNIEFTGTVIPEPATIGMLGLGSVALLAFRRRIK
jgi:hypothetical protein